MVIDVLLYKVYLFIYIERFYSRERERERREREKREGKI